MGQYCPRAWQIMLNLKVKWSWENTLYFYQVITAVFQVLLSALYYLQLSIKRFQKDYWFQTEWDLNRVHCSWHQCVGKLKFRCSMIILTYWYWSHTLIKGKRITSMESFWVGTKLISKTYYSMLIGNTCFKASANIDMTTTEHRQVSKNNQSAWIFFGKKLMSIRSM
jgi:hypothetical protein